mmetsp:Transcript_80100/g.259480  ORF Transcript_80100/g.259480 Transcript_80100/m.259480 type:complete len:207 (+) Transcript_80100:161-781(+)
MRCGHLLGRVSSGRRFLLADALQREPGELHGAGTGGNTLLAMLPASSAIADNRRHTRNQHLRQLNHGVPTLRAVPVPQVHHQGARLAVLRKLHHHGCKRPRTIHREGGRNFKRPGRVDASPLGAVFGGLLPTGASTVPLPNAILVAVNVEGRLEGVAAPILNVDLRAGSATGALGVAIVVIAPGGALVPPHGRKVEANLAATFSPG